MTASASASAPATPSRPVLYLVPGSGRPRRERSPVAPAPGGLPGVAVELVARVLGTVFAPFAADLARGLTERAPLLARRGGAEAWATAIAFLLAEESRLFDHDPRTTRTSLARELGTPLPTLKRRSEAIRTALHPLELDLPEPEVD